MFGVEQQGEGSLTIETNLDLRNLANLDLVCDRGNRPVLGLEYGEANGCIVGEDRARLAPRPEGADRCQREHPGLERQDGSVGRKIVGGRSGGRCNQHSVAGEFGKRHTAVD